MRTTLDVPVELLEEARLKLGYKSKTDTMVFALKAVVQRDRLEDLQALLGTIEFTTDAATLRGKKPARAK
ncbi:MAG: type II toxin-antitoxin system VapB family antitoxin [Vicinamibacterales bacterium]